MNEEVVEYVELVAEVVEYIEAGPQGPVGPQGPPGPYGPKQIIDSGTDAVAAASYAIFFRLADIPGPLIFTMPADPEDRPYLFKDLDGTAGAVPITLTDPTGAVFEKPDGTGTASTLTFELAFSWIALWKVGSLWSIVGQ